MRKLLPLALLAAPVALYSCSGDSFKKTKTGLEYKIVKDQKGTNAQMGDKVELVLQVRLIHGKKDSLLAKSEKRDVNIPPVSFKGDWSEGLTMMSEGDSAVFRMSIDTLMKRNQGGQFPPWMQKGDKLQFEVKYVKVTVDQAGRAQMKQQQEQMEQMQKMMEQMQNGAGQPGQQQGQPQPQAEAPAAADPNQPALDDKKLQEYFAANNLKPKKTASGLYYIIDNPGTGPAIEAGKTVVVNYTGKTLAGETFDSNEDPQFQHMDPFEFPLGGGQVIPGWDEGVALVKKGGKVRLFIPSGLAYGPQGRSALITPNSILTFNVSVTDVK